MHTFYSNFRGNSCVQNYNVYKAVEMYLILIYEPESYFNIAEEREIVFAQKKF